MKVVLSTVTLLLYILPCIPTSGASPISLEPRITPGRQRWIPRRKLAIHEDAAAVTSAADSAAELLEEAGSLLTRSARSVHNRFFLTSRTGYNLAISADGNIYATDRNDPNAVLVHTTVDMAIVVWRGLASGRYLAFDANGNIISTPTMSPLNYFTERLWFHNYHSYESHYHYGRGWFLGISDNGEPLRGRPRQTRHRRHNYPRYEQMFLLRTANRINTD